MPYDVGEDPYIDSATGVLRNLLGIDDDNELELAEARIASIAITKVIATTHLMPSDLTLELLIDIHRQLFGAIYDWAGKLRTVEVSKGATSFARVEYLQMNLQELFGQFAADGYGAANDEREFVEKLAHYYGELNVLHPFREGNGRTIRTFLSLVADSHGYYIAWDEMDQDENTEASIASYNGDETPMYVLLDKITYPVSTD